VTIDHGSPVPVYSQLADILRAQIESGEIERGLPSVRTLMQQYGLSQASVTHALNVLREEGLIIGVVGKGYYVAGSLPSNNRQATRH
jgi:GntR family transcriptional regulator